MEQVKGSSEMREKIVAASRESRLQPGYPQELLPDYFNMCDKYLANAQYNNQDSNHHNHHHHHHHHHNQQNQVPAVHALNHVHPNG